MTTCTLCELPAEPPVTDEAVEGSFCCRGCLEVYRTLGDVDPDSEAVQAELNEGSADPATDVEDAETAYLAVDGMHCSTCEVFLESVARDESGVHDAEASYAAETIKGSYDP